MKVFTNNNSRFVIKFRKQILLSKVISWKTLRRIQIWRRKDKNGEFIDDDIEKSSSDEFDSEYGKENDECNE